LKNLSSIVDEVVVVGRGYVSDETERIVRGISNIALADLAEGESKRIEWDDMGMLLKMALQRKADWILFMDSDETFEPRLRKEIREMVERHDVGMYAFKKYWLWKDDKHYRVDRPDKFLSYAFNTCLVRASTKLRFYNPAGPFLKRLAKHILGKEKLRPYFGRNPVQGFEGKLVNTEIIVLHHAAVNWGHFVKNQIWYASLIAKREPKRDEYSIAEQLYSILDESTLKLEPVRPEWIDY
jgi:glycosyltransferase involved in cell wall biosynthesis